MSLYRFLTLFRHREALSSQQRTTLNVVEFSTSTFETIVTYILDIDNVYTSHAFNMIGLHQARFEAKELDFQHECCQSSGKVYTTFIALYATP